MSRGCKANQSKLTAPATISKVTSSMNESAWEDNDQFMESLAKFMNESWIAVCQMRERSGLSSQYEMSGSEISKRINDVSKLLEDKYKEVQALEGQKAQLMNKSMNAPGPSGVPRTQSPLPQNFQPVAHSSPIQVQGYSGNYDISYSGPTGSSGWPSTTASSGASSTRNRLQHTNSSASTDCPCETSDQSQNFSSSGASSGQYQNFSSGLDYGF